MQRCLERDEFVQLSAVLARARMLVVLSVMFDCEF